MLRYLSFEIICSLLGTNDVQGQISKKKDKAVFFKKMIQKKYRFEQFQSAVERDQTKHKTGLRSQEPLLYL